MKSSPARARSSRSPSGAESTGLPATRDHAGSGRRPAVSISSASAASGQFGYHLGVSGRPGCASARARSPCRVPAGRGARSVAESGNIAPPGRSRLPVRTLSDVDQPAGRGCRTRLCRCRSGRIRRRWVRRRVSRAMARMSSGGHAAVRGDGLGRELPCRVGHFIDSRRRAPRRRPARPASPRRTAWAIDGEAAGRRCRAVIATCRSASSAVRVRRRVDDGQACRRASAAPCSLPGKSGAVHRLPLDSSGLAPMHTRWSVRSRSGTVIADRIAEHVAELRRAWASGPACSRSRRCGCQARG